LSDELPDELPEIDYTIDENGNLLKIGDSKLLRMLFGDDEHEMIDVTPTKEKQSQN